MRSSDLDLAPSVDERREPASESVGAELRDVAVPGPGSRPAAEPMPEPARPRSADCERRHGAPARAAPKASARSGLQKAVAAPPPSRSSRWADREARGRADPGIRSARGAAQREGLEFGEYKIFHRYASAVPQTARRASPLFSVANMVEPGEAGSRHGRRSSDTVRGGRIHGAAGREDGRAGSDGHAEHGAARRLGAGRRAQPRSTRTAAR